MKQVSKGAIHIHTTFSDGTSDVKQIAKAARRAGLNWIIITDHNNLTALNLEGWYEGIAVLVGEEISPKGGNHYLAFDINNEVSENLTPQEYIEEVNKQGGFGFIAHPDESRERKNSFKPLRWDDWDMKGFQGLEIWNYLSDWVDNYDTSSSIYSYFFRNHSLSGPSRATLKWWDRLNSETENIFPAIGSLDSHALNYHGIKIFPYEDSFKTVTNFIYTEKKLSCDFREAKRQIYDAVKSGNNLIVNRIWSKNSDKASFYVENNGKLIFSGDKTETNPENILTVKLPKPANIRIFFNGQIVRNVCTAEFQMSDLKSGKYRAEVYYKDRPWIFSNPIIIE
jgi:hypothetical protein